jgi:hypothetical protein
VATLKVIAKELEAHIAKLEKRETREAEGHEPVEREPETQDREAQEQEVSVLPAKGMSLTKF